MPYSPLPTSAKKNIELIAQVEQQLHSRSTRAERVGRTVAAYFGSFRFIAAHVAAIAAWMAVNLRAFPGVTPFDPYPFNFLSLIVGIEFILLTTFVLMNQSQQSRRQEHWSHLTLQIALLSEQEVTRNMRMLDMICRELGLIEGGDGDNDMTQATEVAALLEEIEKAREGAEEPVSKAAKPERDESASVE